MTGRMRREDFLKRQMMHTRTLVNPNASSRNLFRRIGAFAAVLCLIGVQSDIAAADAEEGKEGLDVLEVTTAAEGTRIEYLSVYSPAMEREIKAVVVLPPCYGEDPSREFPVLYTLHGANAPYDTWAKMSKLRSALADKPFIYTCFDGDAVSMYLDSYYPVSTHRRGEEDTGLKKSLFKTFFFDEFVPVIDRRYRINGEKRGVTGFSMGGLGAVNYMLERPDFFCSVSILSSAFLDLKDREYRGLGRLEKMLGSPEEYPERYAAVDHYGRFAELCASGETFPPIYSHCGLDDFLLEQNRKMTAFLEASGVEIEYAETEGGHDWAFWHPASVGVAEFHWKYFSAEAPANADSSR